ncbi:hypothetical protein L484_017443 [Morus notabilis]|uniref:Transmembrane protein n=1 Tax=Morus notabilis TaxID=981085 RepID=W9QLE9_9ROSA|nr:hypothetical protein L484_017443 [Morus notabilis]
MADWGPVVIAVVLFVLLSPGLLIQFPGRNRVVEFGNMHTSGLSILVHTVIFFGLITILLIAFLRRCLRKIQTRKEKGRWWAFGKVGPIGCLHSSDDTEEERNEVRGRGAGKRVESIRLDDREKQNEIRIWPKKKQRYGYHDRSPSIKKNLSKSLRFRL